MQIYIYNIYLSTSFEHEIYLGFFFNKYVQRKLNWFNFFQKDLKSLFSFFIEKKSYCNIYVYYVISVQTNKNFGKNRDVMGVFILI